MSRYLLRRWNVGGTPSHHLAEAVMSAFRRQSAFLPRDASTPPAKHLPAPKTSFHLESPRLSAVKNARVTDAHRMFSAQRRSPFRRGAAPTDPSAEVPCDSRCLPFLVQVKPACISVYPTTPTAMHGPSNSSRLANYLDHSRVQRRERAGLWLTRTGEVIGECSVGQISSISPSPGTTFEEVDYIQCMSTRS